jgi:hypothetical protein
MSVNRPISDLELIEDLRKEILGLSGAALVQAGELRKIVTKLAKLQVRTAKAESKLEDIERRIVTGQPNRVTN